jgi:hypothetical protein
MAPLTEESAGAYAMFGMRLTAEDVARSQAAHAADPYRGYGTGFDASLVLRLDEGLARPAALAIAPALETLRELCENTRSLEPFVFRGRQTQRKAVLRCISSDCEQFRNVLAQVHRTVTLHMAPNFNLTVLRELHAPMGEPHLPWTSPLNNTPPGPTDYQALVQKMEEWIAWCEALPHAPLQRLLAWADAARRALIFLESRGIRAEAVAPAVCTLRTAPFPGLALVSDAVGDEPERMGWGHPLEAELDRHLNGSRPPRAWPARIMPLADDPLARRLTRQDLDGVLGHVLDEATAPAEH